MIKTRNYKSIIVSIITTKLSSSTESRNDRLKDPLSIKLDIYKLFTMHFIIKTKAIQGGFIPMSPPFW